MTTLVTEIARVVDAYHRCVATNNEFQHTHKATLLSLCEELPSGSGIDRGTQLDLDKSTGQRLVFHADYHYMDESGYYQGWSGYSFVVIPDLMFGFSIRVIGRDRNATKEYLHEVMQTALSRELSAQLA